jgi:UDP-N-acetylmuramoyl-tripeptide--D-alanyl-D-alanine ligase
MQLSTAAKLLQATLHPATAENLNFSGVSTDTRSIQPGNLFVAIKGPHFDGHDFIEQAQIKKAAAVLVDHIRNSSLPYLQVQDTVKALGKLAAHHRDQFLIPMIGITGSCGKTTARALTASILNECAPTLFSESSFNNEIGVPLTLLRLEPQHQFAVIEMGANHFGEIAYLTQLAKPTVALITNAAQAHLEGFGDVAGVCRAKGEIFLGLPEDGIAILNADDMHLSNWEKMVASKKILRFSLSQSTADIYAKQISLNEESKSSFILVTPMGEAPIQFPLAGQHNIANALAAATIAYALNMPLTVIKQGLEKANAVKKRLNFHTLQKGVCLIDDSYNANPLSVSAAIDILACQEGEKILVLGDMRELGEHSETAHRSMGEKARQAGIDRLYAYGHFSALAAEAFNKNAQHFTDQDFLIAQLKENLAPPTTILVKGSLSMKMGRVVEALLKTQK